MNPTQRNAPSSRRDAPTFSAPIPKTAANAFIQHKTKSPQNAGLIFDRFAPDTTNDTKGEAKKTGFEQTLAAAKNADRNLLAAWNARWQRDADSIHAVSFTLKTDWRFITGLGRKGPLEAGFAFNRYGFPILPGSSVKGIARAYALLVEKKTEEDAEFVAIFGRAPKQGEPESAAQSGSAIFLDAIPSSLPTLELDIMNPHFPDYYQGSEFPTDWQSPRPVFFLTVAPQTEFCFAIGWRGKVNTDLQARAENWLRGGLTELGAGAKTSAGYGFFKSDEAAKQVVQATAVAAQTAPTEKVEPARPFTRHAAVGKIRYESGKAYVNIEGQRRRRINWKELGIQEMRDKTDVEIEWDEFEDGKYQVVRVTRKGG